MDGVLRECHFVGDHGRKLSSVTRQAPHGASQEDAVMWIADVNASRRTADNNVGQVELRRLGTVRVEVVDAQDDAVYRAFFCPFFSLGGSGEYRKDGGGEKKFVRKGGIAYNLSSLRPVALRAWAGDKY